MKKNPFGLDYKEALRNPDSMPVIMKRAIANIMLEFKTGKRANGSPSTIRDPGSNMERFKAAFDIISTEFTRNNIIQGRKDSLALTSKGKAHQTQLPRKDEEAKKARLKRLREMDQKERQKAQAFKKQSAQKRLAFLDKMIESLRTDLLDAESE